MILYLIINSILLIKLFLFLLIKIFLIPNVFSKYILIIILIITLVLCYKYPKENILIKEDLFKYALKTKWSHIFNIIVLLFFSCIFIGGIFYLRFFNINKQIDLKDYYVLCKKFFYDFNWIEIIVNSSLILLLIILYISIIYKLTLYFKFHLIKRHIYLVGHTLWYPSLHYNILRPCNIYTDIPYKIKTIFENLYEKYYYNKIQHSPFPDNFYSLADKERKLFLMQNPVIPSLFFHKYKKISYFINILLTKGHYILLLFVIFYDITYNNFILTLIFYILPWTFFYEIFLRISYFVDVTWIPYDQALYNISYSKTLEVIDDNTLCIDGEFYDLSFYKNMYKHYILRSFVKDPEHI